MKYTLSNKINKPLQVVVDKFSAPESVKHWMNGLQKIEPISGTHGEIGAKRNLHFVHKNKKMVIVETILEQNLPNQIKFSYESSMGFNEVELLFEKISETEVKQINNTTIELKGFMKVIGFLFKGMFKKQSLKYMADFKKYAEN